MSETLTPFEILKSKQNFADYIDKHQEELIARFSEGYPKRPINIVSPQLTPNPDAFINNLLKINKTNSCYLFWFIVNEKEEITEGAKVLNLEFKDGFGVFIIRVYIKKCAAESGNNDDNTQDNSEIEFECIVKPALPTKQARKTDTPAKTLQLEYWTKYFEICDELQSEMQVNPKPQHFQYIPIGKAGVQILQTVNTQNKYVATEIMINNKKEIFEKLAEHKTEIEEELGRLEWDSKDNVKSSRIRKYLNYDITNAEEVENAIRNHIKTAEEFKETFKKYL